ncbi:MAG: metal-dependent hydrolase [Gammaproteobacteria bacterium]|nr:metal-dependent hydrolase [Gammaproteobacteria bacterium]
MESARGRYWLGGDPVGTAVLNGLSLVFPDGEKLFMDAVRHFRDKVSGQLADDVRHFLVQEAMHSREHDALNATIDRSKYPVNEILGRIQIRIALTRSKGPYAMLLSTIALEHFTAMMADMLIQNRGLFASVDPEIARLWRWHALEETEHKAVAFDVFLEATKHWSPLKRYLLRCWSMMYVTYNFTRNVANHASCLLQADGYSDAEAKKAVLRFLWRDPGIFRRVWRSYFAWYRPGFHPWDLDNRVALAEWRAEFDVT